MNPLSHILLFFRNFLCPNGLNIFNYKENEMNFSSRFQILKMWTKLLISTVIFTMFCQISAVHSEPIQTEHFNSSILWKKVEDVKNGSAGCTFREVNASINDNGNSLLILKVDEDLVAGYGDPLYSCAEFRSRDRYLYGRYVVRMKAIQGNGLVSSFFIYTDDPQHDEIDIEILGIDCTKVLFGYHTNGVSTGTQYDYQGPAGFNACTDFHNYGIEWQPNSIKFSVDGQVVHTAQAPNLVVPLPINPGRIIMNVWVPDPNKPNVVTWAGGQIFNLIPPFPPPSAEYEWVTYQLW